MGRRHEINNLMGVILASAEYLQRQDLSSEGQSAADQIVDAVGRLGDLLDDQAVTGRARPAAGPTRSRSLPSPT